MKHLILNADDLGFSPHVNAAIFDCVINGSVTAASVMINMPFAESAFRDVRDRCPDLSLGLHFNLTSGNPVSKPNEIPLLVDANGRFCRNFQGLWRLLISEKTRRAARQQIQKEFHGQREKMTDLSTRYHCRFDHLDSHQHVHALSGIYETLENETKNHNLVLRIPVEPFGDWRRFTRRFVNGFPVGLLKRCLLKSLLYDKKCRPIFYGISETGRMSQNALMEIIRAFADSRKLFQTAEINIHPGGSDSLSGAMANPDCSIADRRFHASKWRTREYQAARSNFVRNLCNASGIRLTGFQACALDEKEGNS